MEPTATFRFSLRHLLWMVLYVALLCGITVSTGRGSNPWWVVVLFSLGLGANAAFLVRESNFVAWRWFLLGAAAGMVAALIVAGLSGFASPAVYYISKRSDFMPLVFSLGGAVAMAPGFGVLCGSIAGMLASFRAGQRLATIVSLLFLAALYILWLRTMFLHEPGY